MSFITKRERVFAEADFSDLPLRNEGKLKTLSSCTDNRAWSHYGPDKTEHLIEVTKRNMGRGPQKLLPTDVIVSTLLKTQNFELAKCKRKIQELEQLLKLYSDLDLSNDQKLRLDKASDGIKAAYKEVEDLYLDLDETEDSHGDTGADTFRISPMSEVSAGSTPKRGANTSAIYAETRDKQTMYCDPALADLEDSMIAKDAKLAALSNTIAVLENDLNEPYCIYARIFTSIESIAAILEQDPRYKRHLEYLMSNEDITELPITDKILHKLRVLKKFAIALTSVCSMCNTENNDKYKRHSESRSAEVFYAEVPTVFPTARRYSESIDSTLKHGRSQIFADILEFEETKNCNFDNGSSDEDVPPKKVKPLRFDQIDINMENVHRIKVLQDCIEELSKRLENLKLDKEIIAKRVYSTERLNQQMSAELEDIDFEALAKEKERYKKRCDEVESLKEENLYLREAISSLETEIRAELEINSSKANKVTELTEEVIRLENALSDAAVTCEKSKNDLFCQLSALKCKCMCQEQQITSLNKQLEDILSADQLSDERKQIDDLKSKLIEARRQTQSLQEIIALNENEINYNKSKDYYQEEMEKLQKSLKEKTETIYDLKNQLLELKNFDAIESQRAGSAKHEHETGVNAAISTNEKLNEETSTADPYSDAWQQLENDYQLLLKDNINLRKELEMKCDDYQKSIQHLHDEICSKDAHISDLNMHCQNQESELDRLMCKLDVTENELKSLKNENSLLLAEQKLFLNDLENLKQSFSIVTSEKCSLEREVEEKLEIENQLKRTSTAFENENVYLGEKIKLLKQEIKNTQTELSVCQERIRNLEKEKNQLLESFKKLETEKEKVFEELNNQVLLRKYMAQQISDSEMNTTNLQQQNSLLEDQLREDANQSISQTKQELDELKQERLACLRQIEELEKALNEAEESNTQYLRKLIEQEKHSDELENRINELEDELRIFKTKVQTLTHSKEELQAKKNQEIRESVRSIEDKHAKLIQCLNEEIRFLKTNKDYAVEEKIVAYEKRHVDDMEARNEANLRLKNLRNLFELTVSGIQRLEVLATGTSTLKSDTNEQDINKSVNNISSSINSKIVKIKKLGDAIAEVKSSFRIMTEKADEAQKMLENEKTNILKEKEAAYLLLAGIKNSAMEEKAELQKQIHDSQNRIAFLQNELEKQTYQAENIGQLTTNKIEKLESELISVQNKYQESLDNVLKSSQKIDDLVKENKIYNDMLEKYKNEIEDKQKEIDRLKEDLDILKKEITTRKKDFISEGVLRSEGESLLSAKFDDFIDTPFYQKPLRKSELKRNKLTKGPIEQHSIPSVNASKIKVPEVYENKYSTSTPEENSKVLTELFRFNANEKSMPKNKNSVFLEKDDVRNQYNKIFRSGEKGYNVSQLNQLKMAQSELHQSFNEEKNMSAVNSEISMYVDADQDVEGPIQPTNVFTELPLQHQTIAVVYDLSFNNKLPKTTDLPTHSHPQVQPEILSTSCVKRNNSQRFTDTLNNVSPNYLKNSSENLLKVASEIINNFPHSLHAKTDASLTLVMTTDQKLVDLTALTKENAESNDIISFKGSIKITNNNLVNNVPSRRLQPNLKGIEKSELPNTEELKSYIPDKQKTNFATHNIIDADEYLQTYKNYIPYEESQEVHRHIENLSEANLTSNINRNEDKIYQTNKSSAMQSPSEISPLTHRDIKLKEQSNNDTLERYDLKSPEKKNALSNSIAENKDSTKSGKRSRVDESHNPSNTSIDYNDFQKKQAAQKNEPFGTNNKYASADENRPQIHTDKAETKFFYSPKYTSSNVESTSDYPDYFKQDNSKNPFDNSRSLQLPLNSRKKDENKLQEPISYQVTDSNIYYEKNTNEFFHEPFVGFPSISMPSTLNEIPIDPNSSGKTKLTTLFKGEKSYENTEIPSKYVSTKPINSETQFSYNRSIKESVHSQTHIPHETNKKKENDYSVPFLIGVDITSKEKKVLNTFSKYDEKGGLAKHEISSSRKPSLRIRPMSEKSPSLLGYRTTESSKKPRLKSYPESGKSTDNRSHPEKNNIRMNSNMHSKQGNVKQQALDRLTSMRKSNQQQNQLNVISTHQKLKVAHHVQMPITTLNEDLLANTDSEVDEDINVKMQTQLGTQKYVPMTLKVEPDDIYTSSDNLISQSQGLKSIQNIHDETVKILQAHEHEIESLMSLSIESMKRAETLDQENKELRDAFTLEDAEIPGRNAAGLNETQEDFAAKVEVTQHTSRPAPPTKTLSKTSIEAFDVRPRLKSGPCSCVNDKHVSESLRAIMSKEFTIGGRLAQAKYMQYLASKMVQGNFDDLDIDELTFLHLKICKSWKARQTQEEKWRNRLGRLLMERQRNFQQHLAKLEAAVQAERQKLQEVREAIDPNAQSSKSVSSKNKDFHFKPESMKRMVPVPLQRRKELVVEVPAQLSQFASTYIRSSTPRPHARRPNQRGARKGPDGGVRGDPLFAYLRTHDVDDVPTKLARPSPSPRK